MTGPRDRAARRVVVTRPAAHRLRGPRPTPLREIDEQTGVGAVYMRSLMRAQLRLAVLTLLVVLGTLAALPLVFLLAPAVREVTLLGIPVPWVVLGVLVYPLLLAAGGYYVRQAERTERDFADLLDDR